MFRYFLVGFVFVIGLSFAAGKSNMILIPKGDYTPLFKYGDDSSDTVTVESFYMDVYPVTNLEYQEFIKSNPKWSVDNISNIFSDNGYLNHWNGVFLNEISSYPVVNVSWFAANAYCLALGYRLPTIDEWEYVASSSKTSSFGKNDPRYLQDVLDWYLNSQTKKLVKVNALECNYWGVCGMHGYIWEWVLDFNSVILLNTDAEGGGLEEVLYCGATAINSIDPADYVAFMRFAFRNSLEANYTMSSLGFRCVKNFD